MGFCGEVFGTATMIQKKPSALKKSAFEIPIYLFVALESHPEINFIADLLQKAGHSVKISLMTPNTLIALHALLGTLLMTNTVEKLAKPFLEFLGLGMCDTPYKLPKYHAKLYWHVRDQNDAGHQWLRVLIKHCAAEL